MSDRVRTSVLFSMFVLLAACGGGGGMATTKCADGMMSSTSCTSAQDQMCTASGKTPVAMCIGGQWSACTCGTGTTTGAVTTPAGTSTGTGAVSVCGNNKAEGDEQCDGPDLKQMTCATLGMGTAAAALKCNARCTFDTLMCFAGMNPTGGTGASQGGTGARTTGTAGSGGSGR